MQVAWHTSVRAGVPSAFLLTMWSICKYSRSTSVFPPMQYGYGSRMEKLVHSLNNWGCDLYLGHIVLPSSRSKDLIEMFFTMLFIYDGCGEVQNIFPEGKEIAFAFPPCACL